MAATPTPTAASPLARLAAYAENLSALDGVGKRIGKAVRSALPAGTAKDAISGTWLGHALHPILTDVVIGAWTSANLLDAFGGDDADAGAERLIGIGITAYGPTALTGFADWADSEPADDGIRRAGLVHAWTNLTALALYAASLRARRAGDVGRGKALALAGAGAIGAGGYLGGHLVFRKGVGVDQTTFDPSPDDEWSDALAADALGSEPVSAQVGDTPVLLVRQAGGAIAAIHDRCSHRGCSLATGDVADGVIECPCHGSRFRLADGELLRGPATAPQPAFEAREREGRVEVRARG